MSLASIGESAETSVAAAAYATADVVQSASVASAAAVALAVGTFEYVVAAAGSVAANAGAVTHMGTSGEDHDDLGVG